jgi:protein-S-isoprenylcysteine O-methyltransferase Ste14
MESAILIATVAAWASVHSWLASTRIKGVVRHAVGEDKVRAYRLLYNIFAVITFVPVGWLMRALPDRGPYTINAPWLYVTLGLQALAAACLLLALLQTDVFHFAGVRQLLQFEQASPLINQGFYRWVRHPLYLFGLIFIWLSPVMTRNMLAVRCALTVYIFVGAMLEEVRLGGDFGAAYEHYAANSPMLVPGLRIRGLGRRRPKQLGAPPGPKA